MRHGLEVLLTALVALTRPCDGPSRSVAPDEVAVRDAEQVRRSALVRQRVTIDEAARALRCESSTFTVQAQGNGGGALAVVHVQCDEGVFFELGSYCLNPQKTEIRPRLSELRRSLADSLVLVTGAVDGTAFRNVGDCRVDYDNRLAPKIAAMWRSELPAIDHDPDRYHQQSVCGAGVSAALCRRTLNTRLAFERARTLAAQLGPNAAPVGLDESWFHTHRDECTTQKCVDEGTLDSARRAHIFVLLSGSRNVSRPCTIDSEEGIASLELACLEDASRTSVSTPIQVLSPPPSWSKRQRCLWGYDQLSTLHRALWPSAMRILGIKEVDTCLSDS